LGHFAPQSTDGSCSLGINGHHWGTIYINHVDSGSDKNIKHDITPIDDKFDKFFN
jgi:hypothetical protein